MRKITIILLLMMFSLGLTLPAGGISSEPIYATNDRVSFEAMMEPTPSAFEVGDRPHVDAWRSGLATLDSHRSFEYEVLRPDFSMPTYEIDYGEDIISDAPPDPKKHQPIRIDENKDLKKYPGTGTEDDPKLIDSFLIENERKPLITIENTDLYITISNNFLNGFDAGYDGIIINNAQHITIKFNDIRDSNYGILVMNSFDINVIGNTIYSHLADGVAFDGVTSFDIASNTIHSNGGSGMTVTFSTDGTVSSNTIYSNAGTGITYGNTTNTMLSNNTIYDNGSDGIFFIDSHGNTLYKNNVYDNGYNPPSNTNGLDPLYYNGDKMVFNAAFGGSGIFLDPSLDNNVVENTVANNAGVGIYLLLSNDSIISDNTVTSNGYAGIFFEHSNGNDIARNQIHNNGGSVSSATMGLNAWELISTAAFGGSGIFLDPSYDNDIIDNNITLNFGDGIMLQFSDRTIIDNNNIEGNELRGIFFDSSDNNAITGNTITNNGGTVSSLLSTNAFTSPYEMKVFAAFGGSGIFLDPSFDNRVENNVLTGNEGNGVALFESDNTLVIENYISTNGQEGVILVNSTKNEIAINQITDNGFAAASLFADMALDAEDLRVYAAFGGSGIFLDPSPDNNINDNTIAGNAASGIYFLDTDFSDIVGNIIESNGADGVFLENSNDNIIAENVIEYNGPQTTSLGLDAAFGGSGIFLDPSVGNIVSLNNITGHSDFGIFSEASSFTNVTENRLISNGNYGVAFDDTSTDSFVFGNNFQNNNGVSSQALDNGIANGFTKNFWADHNNNDTDFDGTADEPYTIDGDAENTDSTASNIPNGVNLYNATGTVTPTKLNADSEGTPVTMKIYLADGFRALSINLSRTWLNDTVQAYEYHIIDIQTFTVTFDRQGVNNLINNYAAANGLTPPFFVTLEVHMIMNDGLLDLRAWDDVEVNQIGEPTAPLVGLLAPLAMVPLGTAMKKKKDTE